MRSNNSDGIDVSKYLGEPEIKNKPQHSICKQCKECKNIHDIRHRGALWGFCKLPLFYFVYFYLALVSATLRRLGSLRKPMPWCSLALTQDRMMKSFSLP